MKIDIDVHINTNELAKKFEALRDDESMYEVHNLFAKMMNDYVPMDTGVLSQTVDINISSSSVRYATPYAHYMYVGEVYGPNIPEFDENGIIVGWWSPPGKKKHPTGRPIHYNTEYHPKASKEWDKAMMSEKGEVFLKAVADILLQRCKELYG